MGVRFAVLKLAMMSHMVEKKHPPSNDIVVRIIQSLSRFLGHLASPELSMNYYKNIGWDNEARLRSLIGDR